MAAEALQLLHHEVGRRSPVAFVALASAALLLAGLLTPIAATAASVVALSASPPAFYVASIAAALVLLGPGAASVDARIFGRREIVVGH